MRHYASEMYGDLSYEQTSGNGCDRTIWSDGVIIDSPSPDQRSIGVLGIVPEIFNTTEYLEIVEGETCPNFALSRVQAA